MLLPLVLSFTKLASTLRFTCKINKIAKSTHSLQGTSYHSANNLRVLDPLQLLRNRHIAVQRIILKFQGERINVFVVFRLALNPQKHLKTNLQIRGLDPYASDFLPYFLEAPARLNPALSQELVDQSCTHVHSTIF